MRQANGMVSVLAFLALLAVCGLMLWGSNKIEPHWVSKDAQRIVCYGQGISSRGEPYGRWREVRLTRAGDGTVEVRPRHGTLLKDRYAGGASIAGISGVGNALVKRRAQRVTFWRVNGATPDPPPRRIIYLLDGNDDPTMPELLAIRLPTKSRAIPILESMAINKSKMVNDLLTAVHRSERTPGTTQPVERPDRD